MYFQNEAFSSCFLHIRKSLTTYIRIFRLKFMQNKNLCNNQFFPNLNFEPSWARTMTKKRFGTTFE